MARKINYNNFKDIVSIKDLDENVLDDFNESMEEIRLRNNRRNNLSIISASKVFIK